MNRARTNIHPPAHAANRDFFKIATDGIKLAIKNADTHKEETLTLRVVDWDKENLNDFLAVAQFSMQGPLYKCIPDITLFVNGLPWVVIELKRQGVPAKQGFDDNLTSYKHPQNGVPHLFTYNAFLIASNGEEAKVGSITADWGRFFDWRKNARKRCSAIT